MITDQKTIERFLRKVRKTPICWEWTATKNSDGYGKFSIQGKQPGAHRVSYLIFVADIPLGLFVLHSCDNPGCVNPAHLSLGTNQDNMNDMTVKGRGNRYLGGTHDTREDLEEVKELTIEEVTQIQDLCRLKIASHRRIALWYGTKKAIVTNINRSTVLRAAKQPTN